MKQAILTTLPTLIALLGGCGATSSLRDRGNSGDSREFPLGVGVSNLRYWCAVMSDGSVSCRGDNNLGQLGNGLFGVVQYQSVPVNGVHDATQIVSGWSDPATCVLTTVGTVVCWGSDIWGMLGNAGRGDQECGPSRARCHPVPAVVDGLSDIVSISSSVLSVCAVKRDGTVWCWGSGNALLRGPRTDVPTRIESLRNVEAIQSRGDDWMVRHMDGSYSVLPLGGSEQTLALPRGSAFGSGEGVLTCFLLPDASVRCLTDHRIGLPSGDRYELWDPGLRDVTHLSLSTDHACAVTDDHRVHCWGAPGPEMMDRTDLCASSTVRSACVRNAAETVAGLPDAERVFSGVLSGDCMLAIDHSVWCWGNAAQSVASSSPSRQAW